MLVKDVFHAVLLFLLDRLQQEIRAFEFKLVPRATWMYPDYMDKTEVNSTIACCTHCLESSFKCKAASYSVNGNICRRSASIFVNISEDSEFKIYTNGSVYALIDEEKTWDDAKLNCEAKGWHLVDIKSPQKQALLKDNLYEVMGNRTNGLWIGAKKQNGQFMWWDGSMVEYTSWIPIRPWDIVYQDCVEIHQDGEYNWNNIRCDWLRWSLCELP